MIRLIENSRKRRGQRGFTLIELLVVIAILGILSAIVVFSVRGISDKGQSSAAATDAQVVRTAEEAYCAKFGQYGTMAQLVNPPSGGGFLASASTYTAIELNNSGPCKGPGSAGGGGGNNSGFTIASGAVNIAANADQWEVSDSGSGSGYSSSAFVYPLNSNINEPLVIMNSSLQATPGLAVSWQDIPVGTSRTTFPGMSGTGNTSLPSSPTPYPTCGGIQDRPFCTDTWRFHIRQGVTFQDGQPLTADDVIWTFRDRQALSGSQSDGVSNLRFTLAKSGAAQNCSSSTTLCNFDSVEKIDNFTVDFTPGVQDLRLPEQLVHPKGAIVEVLRDGSGNPIPDVAAMQTPGLSSPRNLGRHLDGSTGGLPAGVQVFGVTGSPAATTLVPGCSAKGQTGCGMPEGTGPFEFLSYHPTNPQGGGTASFTANPNYWGNPGAQVDQMNYSFISDPTVRTAGLESGQYDLDIDINPLDTAGAISKGFRIVSAPYGQNALIYVNKVPKMSPPSLTAGKQGPSTPANYLFNIGTDAAVRQAVSLGIDRSAIVTAVYGGNAAPGQWMSPPGILGSNASLVPPLSTNAGQAATILDNDGWTCGNGAPGAGTVCGSNEVRKWNGASTTSFATGTPLTLYMIGISLVPQSAYSLMSSQLATIGINLVTERATCDSGTTCLDGSVSRAQMYNSSMWDLDVELPNQNDANPAFLPVLRMACPPIGTTSSFRFSPADAPIGTTGSVADTAANGGGTFPEGNTPCTGTTFGPFDATWAPQSANGNDAAAQQAAAEMMHILVNQDQTNVVIPVVGQYRIYGMSSKVNLGDPNPSQTSQRWVSLTKSP